ncbi:putative protein TPRXL isoform X2 [Sparus aurata]|uniref:putative protein TPRXL isoform X2 n=1 Tax=Sparus aurata TaxID=8175 RepID=UPI0011C16044|nr:putative protein TPRXL isoform X2 [Sparus aurata]
MAQRTVRKAILIEALPIRPQDVRLRVPAPACCSSCPKRSGRSSRSSASGAPTRSSSRPTMGPSSSSSSGPSSKSSSRPTLGPSSTSSSRPTLGPSSNSSSPSLSSLRGTPASLVLSDPARITSRKRQQAFTSIWPIPKGPRKPQPPWSGPKPSLVQNQQLWSGPEPEWARKIYLNQLNLCI